MSIPPTRTRKLVASLVVMVTLIAAWKFIDYRTQPPAPPAVAAPL